MNYRLPQLTITQPRRRTAKSVPVRAKERSFDALPFDDSKAEEGFSPLPGFRWYGRGADQESGCEDQQNNKTTSTLGDFSDSISELVHRGSTSQHHSQALASTAQYRQFAQDLFMLPLLGAAEMYQQEQLLLCKKFERGIKLAQAALLGKSCKQELFCKYRGEYKGSDSFFARYFATELQNIVVFLGAYDAFREQLAKRGFLTNQDTTSTQFNVKFCVRLADAHWDALGPFQYVNHIQGIAGLTVKGQLLRTVMQDDADIDGMCYYPQAFRVVTFYENAGKIYLGSNDETTQFLKQYIYLEAVKCLHETLSSSGGDESDDSEGAGTDSAAEGGTAHFGQRFFAALHIVRHFLANTLVDGYPITCQQVIAPQQSQILQLIATYPRAFPVPAFTREFETYSTKVNLYYEQVARADRETLLAEARFLVSEFSKQQQQAYINGFKNVWICKPSQKSRGRGIFASDNLAQLLTLRCEQAAGLPEEDLIDCDDSYIVQKYIERPLLIRGYKFDIRQWVLVSSVNPLIVWQWSKPYLRFCSEPYQNGDFANPFIHLSNNSVQKYSEAFGNSVDGNMWHFSQMCDYIDGAYCEAELQAALASKYDSTIHFARVGDRILYDMARIALTTVHAVRPRLGERNGFELLGYDFLIDEALQVWLLEINASPTMEYSTDLVKGLIEEMAVGYIGILVDACCGRRLQTNGFYLFPKILNTTEALAEGAPGWSLVWKEDGRSKDEVLRTDMSVQGSEIKLPHFGKSRQ